MEMSKLIDALKQSYKADMAKAEATLEIYINSSVGIGEHPQHLEEMDKLIAQYAEAKEKLEVLDKLTGTTQVL